LGTRINPPSDQVGSTLCDHDHRGVRVTRDQLWDDRGVDHPQSVDSTDPQLRVDDRQVIDSHLAGAT